MRNQRLLALKFRREVPVGTYIADFLCFEKLLIIEADGDQHGDNRYDVVRDNWLKSQGYVVMRFSNHDVLNNTESVLATIARDLGLVGSPHPNLLPEGEGAVRANCLSSWERCRGSTC